MKRRARISSNWKLAACLSDIELVRHMPGSRPAISRAFCGSVGQSDRQAKEVSTKAAFADANRRLEGRLNAQQLSSCSRTSHTSAMERAAVVGFAVLLLLICLFWTYGYFRRRSKKRY